MLTNIICSHWSNTLKLCRLIENMKKENPVFGFNMEDFKKDCNGFAKCSECVWYSTRYDKKRDMNMQLRSD